MYRSNRYFWIFAISALVGLNGCAVGPKYQRPSVPMAPAYKEDGPQTWKHAQPNAAVPRGKWWEIYNDPQLNALEEQVSISNQNVIQAMAQYREARDQVRIARSSLFPSASISPSITNSRQSGTISNNVINFTSGTRTIYSMPVDVSYQADVWSSIRRSVTAARDNAQASAADLENARLAYQAQLADYYFELHGLDADADLLQRTVRSYEQYLQLTKDRMESGVASGQDVAQAETQLETTRAQLIDVGVARAQYEHAIAVLIGKPPAQLSIPPVVLKMLPPETPTGLPSDLLQRRPDIAAAERQVASANEQIGIAKAAFFPSVLLGASAGVQSTGPGDWFTWPSHFWSVGPQLVQYVFEGGKRRGQLDLQRAAYDATVAGYRQTVLTAFQQIEDQLAALRILAQEAQIQDSAVKAAQQSLDIATAQYKAGTTDYLTVLTAQTTALANERTAVDLVTRRLSASVLLIEAIGGGWDASRLPKQ